MTSEQALAHSLKLRFGLAPGEPTRDQLAAIKAEILQVAQAGRIPTDGDWSQAVSKACPSAGSWKYSGLDNSDLNALLVLALQAVGGSR